MHFTSAGSVLAIRQAGSGETVPKEHDDLVQGQKHHGQEKGGGPKGQSVGPDEVPGTGIGGRCIRLNSVSESKNAGNGQNEPRQISEKGRFHQKSSGLWTAALRGIEQVVGADF